MGGADCVSKTRSRPSPVGTAVEWVFHLQLGLNAPQLLLPLGQLLLHLGLLHFQALCYPVQPVHISFPAEERKLA